MALLVNLWFYCQTMKKAEEKHHFFLMVILVMKMRFQICARRKCALTAITIPRWNRHLWSPKDGKPYWPFCMFFWSLGSQPLLWSLCMIEFLIWKSIHLCLISSLTMFLIFLGPSKCANWLVWFYFPYGFLWFFFTSIVSFWWEDFFQLVVQYSC